MLSAFQHFRNYASTNSQLTPVLRGMMHRIDPVLTGQRRFAKALGNDAVVLFADTSLALTTDLTTSDTAIHTANIVDSAVPGCLLRLSDAHTVAISEIVAKLDGNDSVYDWVLDPSFSAVTQTYPRESRVQIYAFPVIAVNARKAGDTSIQIDSPLPIWPGDELFAMPAVDNVSTTTGRNIPIRVESGHAVVQAITNCLPYAEGGYRYSLTVSGLVFDAEEYSTLYILAKTAYESEVLPVPEVFGPVGFDLVSGYTLGGGREDIRVAVNVFGPDREEEPIRYSDVTKNTPIAFNNVRPSSFAFGKVDAGKLHPDQSGGLRVLPDSTGRAGFGYDFGMKAPLVLNAQVACSGSGVLMVVTDAGTQRFELGVGSLVLRLVETTSFIIFRFLVDPADVVMLTPLADDHGIAFVSYSVVAEVPYGFDWGMSGGVLKPLMPDLSELNAWKSDYISVNSGAIL